MIYPLADSIKSERLTSILQTTLTMTDSYLVYVTAKCELYMTEYTKARKNATMENNTP